MCAINIAQSVRAAHGQQQIENPEATAIAVTQSLIDKGLAHPKGGIELVKQDFVLKHILNLLLPNFNISVRSYTYIDRRLSVSDFKVQASGLATHSTILSYQNVEDGKWALEGHSLVLLKKGEGENPIYVFSDPDVPEHEYWYHVLPLTITFTGEGNRKIETMELVEDENSPIKRQRTAKSSITVVSRIQDASISPKLTH